MLDEFEIALSQITSPTFPRQSWRLQWRTRRKISPRYWARFIKKWSADIKKGWISIWWQTFVGCWKGNMMKGRKRKRNPLHRSFEDKKVRKNKKSKRKT